MDHKELLEKAMKKARQEAGRKKDKKDADVARIDTFTAVVLSKLELLLKKSRKPLNAFEKEIMSTMVDLPKLKQDRARTKESIKIIRRLHDEYKMKVKYSRNFRESGEYRKEYYGRIKSILKKIDFNEMEKFNALLKKIPRVKDRPTIIICGPPNVGKSEFLKSLSGKEVEVQPYPFTTKNLLIANYEKDHIKYQWIDTPGLLDRPAKKRNKIEKRAVAAIAHLSKKLLFLLDPSEYCGTKLENQLQLAESIREELKPEKMILVATHADVTKKKVKGVIAHVNAKKPEQVREVADKVIKELFK